MSMSSAGQISMRSTRMFASGERTITSHSPPGVENRGDDGGNQGIRARCSQAARERPADDHHERDQQDVERFVNEQRTD